MGNLSRQKEEEELFYFSHPEIIFFSFLEHPRGHLYEIFRKSLCLIDATIFGTFRCAIDLFRMYVYRARLLCSFCIYVQILYFSTVPKIFFSIYQVAILASGLSFSLWEKKWKNYLHFEIRETRRIFFFSSALSLPIDKFFIYIL